MFTQLQDTDEPGGDPRMSPSSDLRTQFWLAFALGSTAITFFCLLRRRWSELYAARSTLLGLQLPELSTSLWKWVVDLIRIPDATVQQCAGLDGFVFLLFFRMAMKFLSFASLLGVTVIIPVNKYFRDDAFGNITFVSTSSTEGVKVSGFFSIIDFFRRKYDEISEWPGFAQKGDGFLYLYVAFTYIISIFLLYVLFASTKQIADIRQTYLARQTRLTDRTVLVSGLPPELRSELALKRYLNDLKIGTVERICICRNYTLMDKILSNRNRYMHSLEYYWAKYLRNCERLGLPVASSAYDISSPVANNSYNESSSLLAAAEYRLCRPLIRSHFFKCCGKKIDAIDYYSAKLYKCDKRLDAAHHVDFTATGQAFVTFESMASAQIAAQTHIDMKSLMGLHIILAPSPQDVQWHNTYMGRWHRFFQSWFVSVITLLLILLWTVPVGAIAVLINIDTIRKLWPSLARLLEDVPFMRTLIQTFLPTLVYSLFINFSPFLFRWLSRMQGFSSRGEEEIYTVGKNYAYLFVNFFLVYIIAGTSNIWSWAHDATQFAILLANRLPKQAQFFIDLIVLQGIGMLPFRLAQFGNLFSFAVRRWRARTLRDYKSLQQPDSFSYGIYLPQPLFIMLICLCYSIISPLILVFGLIYFTMGFIVYKYELIYAMEHPQHSTGQLWSTIFQRMVMSCAIMQMTMMGLMSLRRAYWLSTVIAPLLIFTLASSYNFFKMISPAMNFVSLYYIQREQAHPIARTRESSSSGSATPYVHPGFASALEQPLIDSVPSANELV
ncbi:DUF221 family protein [Schizosaccharomyces japonicus yFS275]|uniref:DUF221 family protein n=1 Tax=Schizosaccharomyces japonicus (strain yFS275 / FY16936) TaxID=402676 RepID=B6K5C5_SCHJY|nr:DUF221 family protein [Schizosaccharomyces japonicus yFS275]EEB08729.2 DUF221 family protein [Schizosaccharomyces japonicus yFS275]